MQVIPTAPVPAQTFGCVLGLQAANITLRQLSTGLYMDLQVGTTEIVGLVICENANPIVRNAYLGFQGDLFFIDTTGQGLDPFYLGLGTQFQLIYAAAGELPTPYGGS